MPNKFKHRQGLLNLGLLVVVLLLAITVWKVNRPRKSEGHVLIADFRSGLVSQIHLMLRDKAPIHFVMRKNIWYIQEPIQVRANPLLVHALLSLPQQRTTHRYPIKGLSLQQYGLNPPRVTIQYGGGDQIELGRLNPIDHLQYVRINHHVYLIQDALEGVSQLSPLGWASLSLLPPQSRIEAVNFPTASIHATPSGNWSISPQTRGYGTGQTETLIKAWTSISAYRLTPSPGNVSHAKPNANGQIRITLKNGKVYSFKIISIAPELILRRTDLGIDYHLPATADKTLIMLGDKIRSQAK